MLRYERRGDEAGNRTADRYAANRDNRKGRTQFARGGFGIQGHDVGDNAADAKACKQAQPEHLIEICRIGRRQGENAEEQVRPDQRRLAAVAVTDPTKQCRTKQNANETCAEHRTERAGFQPPFPDQTWGRERDRGDVVAIDKNNKKRPDNQLDLK